METDNPKKPLNEKPPFFSSWNKLYAFVAIYLAVLIAVFYSITVALG